MAYLRGGTYVDGNLNVEGSLLVNSLSSSSGNVPYYKDSSSDKDTNAILIVNSSDGDVQSSHLYVDKSKTISDTTDTTNLVDGIALYYKAPTNSDYVKHGQKILIDNTLTQNSGKIISIFELDPSSNTWSFVDYES